MGSREFEFSRRGRPDMHCDECDRLMAELARARRLEVSPEFLHKMDALADEKAKLVLQVDEKRRALERCEEENSKFMKKIARLTLALEEIRDYIIKIGPDQGPPAVYGMACVALSLGNFAEKRNDQAEVKTGGICGWTCTVIGCEAHRIVKENQRGTYWCVRCSLLVPENVPCPKCGSK